MSEERVDKLKSQFNSDRLNPSHLNTDLNRKDSSILDKITPLILTYNESPNIDRTLAKLIWAKRIVVIDSFSTDDTLKKLQSYPQVEVFQRKFDSFANQCNFGIDKIASSWVLSIDADYVLSDHFIDEIGTKLNKSEIDGFFVNFRYCVFGTPLKGTLLPPREVLFKADKGFYIDDGHAHKLIVKGKSDLLESCIYHDDRKSLSRWLWAQDRYMVIEAKKLIETPSANLSYGDKIRKQKFAAPLIIFFYCLILKGGIFDGWAGWYYAFQRMLAETLLSIRIIEQERSC